MMGPCHSVIEVLYGSFTSMASQSWNFCWVINFLCVLWNPMRRHRKNMVWYHLFSWTMSLASVVYALAYQTYECVACACIVHVRCCSSRCTHDFV